MLTKQRPARLSCSQKTCTTIYNKKGVDTEVTSVYLLPSFLCMCQMCLWIVLRCLFYYATADKQLISVTLLLTWT